MEQTITIALIEEGQKKEDKHLLKEIQVKEAETQKKEVRKGKITAEALEKKVMMELKRKYNLRSKLRNEDK